MKEYPEYVYKNGEIIPYQDAMIHAMSPCVKYGAMVFEGIRAYWNEEQGKQYLFRLEDHAKRMLISAKLCRMAHSFTLDDICEANIKLLSALKYHGDMHIRQMMYVDGDGELGSSGPISLISVALPRGRAKASETGLNVAVSSWSRIDDRMMPPRIKASANYQNGRLGKMQAKLDGYDSCIFLNTQGKVTEGPGACLFIVRNGNLLTPPTTAGILESITRDTLITLAEQHLQIDVQERDIDRTELYIADEAFFCGSGEELTPIVSIDKHQIGDGVLGRISELIRSLYLDTTRGCRTEYSDWLTAVEVGKGVAGL